MPFRTGQRVEFFDLDHWRPAVVSHPRRPFPAKDGSTIIYLEVRPLIGDRLSQSTYIFRLDENGTSTEVRTPEEDDA
jgi:hypothetical protein